MPSTDKAIQVYFETLQVNLTDEHQALLKLQIFSNQEAMLSS